MAATDDDDADLNSLLSLLELHEDISRKVVTVNDRLRRLEEYEERLSVMQEVQTGFMAEVDAIRDRVEEGERERRGGGGFIRGDGVSEDRLFAALEERDTRWRREARRDRRRWHRELYFFSDSSDGDEEEEEEQEEEHNSVYSVSLSASANSRASLPPASSSTTTAAAATGAVPKRPSFSSSFAAAAAARRGKDEGRREKEIQTEEFGHGQGSSQADIAEPMVWSFINSDLRKRMEVILDETLRGRMQNTLHEMIDRSLQKMVEEAFAKPAHEKTLDKVMNIVREEVKGQLPDVVKEVLDGCVRREVSKAKAEIIEEVANSLLFPEEEVVDGDEGQEVTLADLGNISLSSPAHTANRRGTTTISSGLSERGGSSPPHLSASAKEFVPSGATATKAAAASTLSSGGSSSLSPAKKSSQQQQQEQLSTPVQVRPGPGIAVPAPTVVLSPSVAARGVQYRPPNLAAAVMMPTYLGPPMWNSYRK